MCEYIQSTHFEQVSQQCANGEYPVVSCLFYDKFRNYRLCAGSSGGLYFSLMNFTRKHRSKPRNIFLVSLLKEGWDYDDVMSAVLKEISLLNNVHQVYHASLKKYIKIRVFLGIYVADMPERHVARGMMSHSGNHSKCIHCYGTDSNIFQSMSDYDFSEHMRSKDTTAADIKKCIDEYNDKKTKAACNVSATRNRSRKDYHQY